jgi:predicted GNAT family acetyltransferase
MTWQLTDDVERFHAHADDYLRAHPIQHTVLLSVVDMLRTCGPADGRDGGGRDGERRDGASAWFGWWREDGRVVGAFLHTSPHPVLLGRMPRIAALDLADELTKRHLSPNGVTGDAATTPVFAAAWEQGTNAFSEVTAWHRLFRLDRLEWPVPLARGAARLATPGDRDLVLTWHAAFELEVLGATRPNAAWFEHRLGYHGLSLWEVDGEPVCMASRTPQLCGTVRVTSVYTPPARRGQGYATALTATISDTVPAGTENVLIFTDLANPTSNAIYQRLGYRPVEDRLLIAFDYPPIPDNTS